MKNMQDIIFDLRVIAGNFETRATDMSVNHEKYNALLKTMGVSPAQATEGTWRAAAEDVINLLKQIDPGF